MELAGYRPLRPVAYCITDVCYTPRTGQPNVAKAEKAAARKAFLRPTLSQLDLSLLRDLQCVIDLDPKVSNSALQLGVTEQELVEREIPKKQSFLEKLQKRGLQVQVMGL